MSQPSNQSSNGVSVFDRCTPLPDTELRRREKTLMGFERRYQRVRDQLGLLLNLSRLPEWSTRHHGSVLGLCELVGDQYPLAIFHGDVGTGKTATAECVANRLVAEAGEQAEDSLLFTLSTRVRGSGRVGEMGTLLTEAFREVAQAAGKGRRAILIIDEGDSLAAKRSQEHSHHEDKVAVNTLIQGIDELRRFEGRILVILCTNRLQALDAAVLRRAAVVEPFLRPSEKERRELLQMDLAGVRLSEEEMTALVVATGEGRGTPFTYSDIRTRLYPAALAKAFPTRALTAQDLLDTAREISPSPVMEDY